MLRKLIIITFIFVTASFSQMSFQFSSKDLISVDIGFSALYDFDNTYFVVGKDSVSSVEYGVGIGNSFGLFSYDLMTGYSWGKDYGHNGFDNTFIYIMNGYNWVNILFNETGFFTGFGIKKTMFIFCAKAEYQYNYSRSQHLILFEIGIGL